MVDKLILTSLESITRLKSLAFNTFKIVPLKDREIKTILTVFHPKLNFRMLIFL